MKALIFTCSYNRPHMLRQCMLNAKNQSYENCIHTVNIVSDGGKDQNFLPLYDDLLDDKLIVTKGNNNQIHINEVIAIKSVPDYNDYDVFVKMDDDDIYKKDYVKNIIELFQANPDVDIVSSRINHQLNGIQMFSNDLGYDNLGGNPNNSLYHMPMTFAFNKKALDAIINIPLHEVGWNDDMLWRYKWEDNNLKHMAVDNREDCIWHIHGKNISTSSFLRQ
jgi:cellulose synthase/poly-beta-1,6-N-acetylglucosamine synthase-like glycosyltransferase